MVGSYICNDTDIAMIETKTGPDYAAACRFENGNIDSRIFQHKLGRDRTGIVAGHDLLVANVRTVGGCKTNRSATVF